MTILKSKEIAKMSEKDRKDKLKELELELIKANVTANKTKSRTKEIKKAIARVLSINTIEANKLQALKN